jgi:hypothetical protein
VWPTASRTAVLEARLVTSLFYSLVHGVVSTLLRNALDDFGHMPSGTIARRDGRIPCPTEFFRRGVLPTFIIRGTTATLAARIVLREVFTPNPGGTLTASVAPAARAPVSTVSAAVVPVMICPVHLRAHIRHPAHRDDSASSVVPSSMQRTDRALRLTQTLQRP